MLTLHGLKGQIVGQIQKDLLRDDVRLLASNINQTAGTQWQTVIKFRDTRQSFPAVFGFALCLHDAFQREPFIIEMSESEARGKLKAWGTTASEVDKLINVKLEEK